MSLDEKECWFRLFQKVASIDDTRGDRAKVSALLAELEALFLPDGGEREYFVGRLLGGTRQWIEHHPALKQKTSGPVSSWQNSGGDVASWSPRG